MAHILGLDIDKHVVRGAMLKTGISRAEFLSFYEVAIDAGESDETGTPISRALAELAAQISRAPDSVIGSLNGREASLHRFRGLGLDGS